MAFPPTLPSTADVSNTTLMANRHPGDHNLIADALQDIVTQVQTDGTNISTLLAGMKLLAWSGVDNAAQGVTSANVITMSYTVPAANHKILLLGQLAAAWSSTFAATDLVTFGLAIDGTTTYSGTCTTIPYGSGTAAWQATVGFISVNPTAAAHSAVWSTGRLTGSSPLNVSTIGWAVAIDLGTMGAS